MFHQHVTLHSLTSHVPPAHVTRHFFTSHVPLAHVTFQTSTYHSPLSQITCPTSTYHSPFCHVTCSTITYVSPFSHVTDSTSTCGGGGKGGVHLAIPLYVLQRSRFNLSLPSCFHLTLLFFHVKNIEWPSHEANSGRLHQRQCLISNPPTPIRKHGDLVTESDSF